MIYLTLKHLRPGMVLARTITDNLTVLPLLVDGQILSNRTINRLEELNIPGVYIESSISSDIEVEEFISPALKKQVTVELKSLYSSYLKKKPISASIAKSMSDVATSLMQYVLSKDECLMNIIEIKDYDTYTYSHSIYVGLLSVLIGIQLNYPKSILTELALCGLLHDIGKLDIPLHITNKNGPLTAGEFHQMQTHPDNAVRHLEASHQFSTTILKGIESHHEKFDGTGYPRGITGEEIPIFGRILALADVYDALTSSRSYRKAWTSNEAIEYIMSCSGTQFDANILQVFLKTIAAYPIGTIVQLSNDYIGIVIKNSPDNTLRPSVRIISPASNLNLEIDLSSDYNYLNVTILGTIDENTPMPSSIFE